MIALPEHWPSQSNQSSLRRVVTSFIALSGYHLTSCQAVAEAAVSVALAALGPHAACHQTQMRYLISTLAFRLVEHIVIFAKCIPYFMTMLVLLIMIIGSERCIFIIASAFIVCLTTIELEFLYIFLFFSSFVQSCVLRYFLRLVELLSNLGVNLVLWTVWRSIYLIKNHK